MADLREHGDLNRLLRTEQALRAAEARVVELVEAFDATGGDWTHTVKRLLDLEAALKDQERGWQGILDGEEVSRELAYAYRDAARAALKGKNHGD